MKNKNCLITGATSGIGEATSLELAKQGANIFFIARNKKKAEFLKETIYKETGKESVYFIADLSSQDQIKEAASEFLKLNIPLHVLLNNAGIINLERKETVDEFEEVFSVNHLAYHSLSLLLLQKLEESSPSRIVNVSSAAHAFVKDIDLDDLQSKETFKAMNVYGKSKLANILFTRELSRKVFEKGITVNCLHPGFVATNFGTQNDSFWGRLAMKIATPFARKSFQGASSSIYLCSSNEVEEISGEYFYDCKIGKLTSAASNDETAAKLWKLTEDLTGIKF
ncbi:MAG: SDR family oxidoreductase [SAR86 cluster bacterium]|nr:SDR family oxidoreductase [SAR86 cluster bacterium]